MSPSAQKTLWTAAFCISFSLVLALGCGQPHRWPVEGPGPLPGRLVVKLAGSTAPDVTSLFVTIDHIDAVTPAGTIPVMDTPVTVDLLSLQEGGALELGNLMLPEGEVSQLRVLLAPGEGHSVVLSDGTTSPMRIPSGDPSALRLTGPFGISSCSETALILDLDGERSVLPHPAGPEHPFILRPVMDVLHVEAAAAGCDAIDDPRAVPLR